MRTIDEDIKNNTFRTAYLLYGEEAYLKKQYKDKLRAALWQEGDTMNAAFYQGKNTNPKELIDLAETMPFFCGSPSHSRGGFRLFQERGGRSGRIYGACSGHDDVCVC